MDQYTVAVRDFVAGVNQDVPFAEAPHGLGLPAPTSHDVARIGHGSAGGVDSVNLRPFELPLLIIESGGATAESLLDQLKLAWRYTVDFDEVPMDLRMAGEERRYYGRTRGLDVDLAYLNHGVIEGIIGHFEALDPWAYGPELTGTSNDGSLEITNPGTIESKRAVLTATVGTTTATITNTADPDGLTMLFTNVIEDTLAIDLSGDISDQDDEIRDGRLQTGSGWPVVQPGVNVFTFTGFTQLDITWRPAYL